MKVLSALFIVGILAGCGGPKYYIIPPGMTAEQAAAAVEAKKAAEAAATRVIIIQTTCHPYYICYPPPYPYAGILVPSFGGSINFHYHGGRRR